jgi:threonine dehydrogenase-like Zn-dependent dehydrogenase
MIEVEVARLLGPGEIAWEREAIYPGALKDDEVLAETMYSAISPGTEVAAYSGLPPLRPGRIYPRLVGYCNVAKVVSMGTKVTDLWPGDTILTHQSHRSGFICRRRDVLAVVAPDHDGVAASVSYLFHLGHAALMKGGFHAGMTVGVIGLGPIGLATLALVASGGGEALAFTNQERVADRATACGARAVLRKDGAAAFRTSTGSSGVDIVVTTSNSWNDWRLAMSIARTGGTICVLGFPGRGEPAPALNPLASEFFYDKQLTVMACGIVPDLDVGEGDVRFTLKRNMAWIVDRAGRGLLPTGQLISERAPAHDLDRLYRRLAAREPGLVTAVLTW